MFDGFDYISRHEADVTEADVKCANFLLLMTFLPLGLIAMGAWLWHVLHL